MTKLGGVEDPPSFKPKFHPRFQADRQKLGLTGSNFTAHFKDVERHVCFYPWSSASEEVKDGVRMIATEDRAPDLPKLYAYYRVDFERYEVEFLRLSPAWSQTDVPFPEPLP